MREKLKMAAAAAALEHVEDGMLLGLGTGTTTEAFLRLLAQRVHAGLSVRGVPTSRRTQELCDSLGIPHVSLEDHPQLDLAIDGADEIGPRLTLVKGGGGALLHERIVAAAARRFIVISDESKLVSAIGAFGIPIEIVPFGARSTCMAIAALARRRGLEETLTIRRRGEGHYVTDGGHLIVDAFFGLIHDAEELSDDLLRIPGIVQHGIFIGLASRALVAGADGIREIFP